MFHQALRRGALSEGSVQSDDTLEVERKHQLRSGPLKEQGLKRVVSPLPYRLDRSRAPLAGVFKRPYSPV